MEIRELFEPSVGAYFEYCVGFAIRYAAVAGGLVWLLHRWGRARFLRYRIQQSFPSLAEIKHEIAWSGSNALCTGISTMLLYTLIRDGKTRMYFELGAHGWPYLFFSVAAGVLAYDAWFYWQHRLLHTPLMFRHVHRVHHRITNPTALATFAHHPLETFLGNGFFLLLPLVLPLHPLAFAAIGVAAFGTGILWHTGYELFPAGFVHHPLFRWQNTSTHHNMHHSHTDCNYGLFFNWWDRWMGTNHADYSRTFDRVTARHPRLAPEAGEPSASPVVECP